MCKECFVDYPRAGEVVYSECELCGAKDEMPLEVHPELGYMTFCVEQGPGSVHAGRMKALEAK